VKLAALHLDAFGPFTGVRLDFGAGGANLHLIHGPNEAGKSSALRAISDLRFGIGLRSQDDFVHRAGDLKIGAVFVTPQGEQVGYARRKKRTNALGRINLATNEIAWEGSTSPADELALNGGFDRNQFEIMFGLDHARLRQGGADLVEGKAELSGALFQASSGVGSVSAILEALDAEAKALYNPHGRAVNAVLNEARRQFEEARRAYRESQVRPQDWVGRKRAHEAAESALKTVADALATSRRRATELAQLRAVAPLLRTLETANAHLADLESAPLLPADAAQVRSAAQVNLDNANAAAADAQQQIDQANAKLAQMPAQTSLLSIAEAMDRFAVAADDAPQLRTDLEANEAAITQATTAISAAAKQIAPELDAEGALALLPSDVDRIRIDEEVQSLDAALMKISELEESVAGVERDLAQARDGLSIVGQAERKALQTAIFDAVALGEINARIDQHRIASRSASVAARQALEDLNVESEEQLREAAPLLQATIDATDAILTQAAAALSTIGAEESRLKSDIAERERRLMELQAAGEIVTADLLQEARARRDKGWVLVRRAYIDSNEDPSTLALELHPSLSLPEAFEHAQETADRRADILRLDAQRATQAAECVARIAEMTARRTQIAEEVESINTRVEEATSSWQRQLGAAKLPQLSCAELKQWQAKRSEAIGFLDQHSVESAQQNEKEASATAAANKLALAIDAAQAALDGVAAAARDRVSAATLPSLIREGREVTGRIELRDTQTAESTAARRTRLEQKTRFEAQLAAAIERKNSLEKALAPVRSNLMLAAQCAGTQISARLSELDRIAAQSEAIAQLQQKCAQQVAKLNDLVQRAQGIAIALNEPEPQDLRERLELYGAQLRRRLQDARSVEEERKSLQKSIEQASAALERARRKSKEAEETIAELCRAASVADIEHLPHAEELSERKRVAQKSASEASAQLRTATAWDIDEIRRRLDELDPDQLPVLLQEESAAILRLESDLSEAQTKEQAARRYLEEVDTSDVAARAREAMEQAAARFRAGLQPWARLRLAHALLRETMDRYGKRAQAPMLQRAQGYFAIMTGGRYPELGTDDEGERPVLVARRSDGASIGIEAMSEGTRDQLYLALRLAALDIQRTERSEMPLVLDDVLITSDDQRAANILNALVQFANDNQVLLFTHHRHLLGVAEAALTPGSYAVHELAL